MVSKIQTPVRGFWDVKPLWLAQLIKVRKISYEMDTKTLRFAQNWPEAASPLEIKVLLPWQQIFISKRVPLKSATSSFDPDSPRDKFSVCDCENKCGSIDTLGLRLMHFCLRNLPPLATPSLRRILMPGMMGELAWGSELHSLLMSAPLWWSTI